MQPQLTHLNFSVTVLGSNSAIPANGRFPSAQVVNIQEQLFLIDCGEGTQIRMSDFKIKRSKINQIFISHLHGDHIFGLPGLLNSFALNGRKETLEIFSPKGLERLIDLIFETTDAHQSFDIVFHEIDTEQHQLIFQNEKVKVYSIPLNHRIPTTGFLFKEKPFPKKIIPEKIIEYDIPFSKINEIKQGADFTRNEGLVIQNTELVFEGKPPRSFAYCSDTSYFQKIIPFIKNVDLLYHEATYMEDKVGVANERGHSTAKEAAKIAKLSGAKQLMLGHFSNRYKNLNPLLDEAKEVFENSVLAIEGKTVAIDFS